MSNKIPTAKTKSTKQKLNRKNQKHDREFIKPKISLTDKSNQIAKESFQIKI